jgi:uncharacterized protein (DUF1697 family)
VTRNARRQPYVVLLRGINVGGKNKIPMAALRTFLEGLGFAKVSTYIASGNAVLASDLGPSEIRTRIERGLPKTFPLDDDLVKVLVLSKAQLRAVIDDRPKGFGGQPNKYHSDVLFLIDLPVDEAMGVFQPREGVDKVWPGPGVVYSQRLSAERTKSRLNRVMATPAYKSMTIRNWNTTVAMLEKLEALDE